MTTIPFDTLQFATDLIESGISEVQATAITKAVSKAQQEALTTVIEQVKHDYKLDEVATQRDLKELELALKRDIKDMDTALKHDIELLRAETGRMIAETNQRIAETKAELIRWVVGAGLLQTSLIIGALMKMAHLI